MSNPIRLASIAFVLMMTLPSFAPPVSAVPGIVQCDPDFLQYTTTKNESLPSGTTWITSYAYTFGDYVSAPVVFVDTCKSSPIPDATYEFGRGGLLLTAPLPERVLLADDTGRHVQFYFGTDADGAGLVGDDIRDCLQGPFRDVAAPACPPDAHGHVIVFLLEEEDYPFLNPTGISEGVTMLCRKLGPHCGRPEIGYPIGGSAPPAQTDRDNDGFGDPWASNFKTFVNSVGNPLLSGKLADADQDGLNNLAEFRWDLIPIDPTWPTNGTKVFPNARDHDQDGWLDGPEVIYWNDSGNDADLDSAEWSNKQLAPRDTDYTMDTDGDNSRNLDDKDSDDDGVFDGEEWDRGTYPEFTDSDCAVTARSCPTPRVIGNMWTAKQHASAPGTGDRLDDLRENTSWRTYDTPSVKAWNTDFDHDGIANNLLDPDADDDGLLDALEMTGLTTPKHPDTDGDGLLDGGQDVTVTTQDTRYAYLASKAVVYQQVGPTTRKFYGDFAPTNPDANANGKPDGQDVLEGDPLARRDREETVEDYNPLNRELDSVDPTAENWLNQSVEGRAKNTTSSGLALLNAPPDPAGLLQVAQDNLNRTPVPLPIPLPTAWALETAANVEACVPSANLQVSLDALPCLQSAVEGAATGGLSIIDQAAISIAAPTRGLIDRLNGSNLTRLVPTLPNLTELDRRVVLPGPENSGDMPGPASPWDPLNPPVVAPREVNWTETPFPNFTARTTGMLGSSLFEIIAGYDRGDPAKAELVGTVDSTHYNIFVEDATNPTSKRNKTVYDIVVGVPCPIVFSDPGQTCSVGAGLNADMIVKAELTPGLTQTPRLTVQNLKGLRTFTAAFLEIPNSQYVVALGSDGRNHSLPSTLEFALGTNALQRQLGTDAVYSLHAATPLGNTAPATLAASYIKVDNAQPTKRPDPSERYDILLNLRPAPSILDATITLDTQEGGTDVTWTAGSSAVVLGAARTVSGGVTTQAYVEANAVPSTFEASVRPTTTGATFAYEAAAVLNNVNISWNATNASGRSEGGILLEQLPRSASAVLDMSQSLFSFTAAPELGRVRLTAHRLTGGDEAPPCIEASGIPHVTYVNRTWGSCANLDLKRVERVNVRFDTNVTLGLDLGQQYPGFVTQLDDHAGARIFADVGPLPESTTVTIVRDVSSASLTGDVSVPLDWLNVDYEQGQAKLKVKAERLPRTFTASAAYPTGSLAVNALTDTRIGDISFLYTTGREVGLGDNDGVLLLGSGNSLQAAALRLRDFRSADVRFYPKTGLHATTDTLSTNPFLFHWSAGDSWLSGKLPKLPSGISATYSNTPAAFEFHYQSDEIIPGLEGEFNLSDAGATAYVFLRNFPKKVDVVVQHETGQVSATTDSPIDYLEAGLAQTRQGILDALRLSQDNYLELDKTKEVQLEGQEAKLPSFYVRLKDFKSFHANVSGGKLGIQSRSNTTPGTLGLRYVEKDGWLNVDVPTLLPPEIDIVANKTDIVWSATKGSTFDCTGDINLNGLHGSWELRGIPDYVNLNWTSVNNEFHARFNHSGEKLTLVNVTSTVNLSDQMPNALFHLKVADAASNIHVDTDTSVGAFTLRVTDKHGIESDATVEGGFVADATKGIPWSHMTTEGALYARLTRDAPSEFFVRLQAVKSVAARTTPDPFDGNARWLRYHAKDPVYVRADIQDSDGQGIRGNATLPTTLDARLVMDAAKDVLFTLDASTVAPHWDLDWVGSGQIVRASGSLPRHLEAETKNGIARLDASDPMTLSFAYGNVSTSLIPREPLDYVVARLTGTSKAIAVHVTGLQKVYANMDAGLLLVKRDSGLDIRLDILGTDGAYYGTIKGLPTEAQALMQSNGVFQWNASSSTGTVDIQAHRLGKVWRLNATGVPTYAIAWVAPGNSTAVLRTAGGSFTSLEAAYAGDNSAQAPRLDGPGAMVDFSQGRQRFAARVDDLTSLDIRKTGTWVNATFDRADSGGAFVVRYKDASWDVRAEALSLPQQLSAFWERLPNGSHVRLWSPTDSLGSATVNASGSTLGYANVSFTNLPSTMDLRVTGDRTTGWDLRAEANADTDLTAHGNLTTPEGYRVAFGATLPRLLTARIDKTTPYVDIQATDGTLSGWMTLTATGAKTSRVPDREGASLSATAGTEQAWVNLRDVTQLKYAPQGDKTTITLARTSASSDSFFLHYENETISGNLTLRGAPATLTTIVRRTDTNTTVDYSASSNGTEARVMLDLKGNSRRLVDARLWDVPAAANVTYEALANDVKRVTWTHSGAVGTPDVTVSVNGSDESYVTAKVLDLPTSLTLNVDPKTRAAGTCAFSLTIASPVTLFMANAGTGPRQNGGGLRSGGANHQWIGVNLYHEKAPAFDILLRNVGSGSFCYGQEGDFTASAGVGAADVLRLAYQDKATFVTGSITTLPAGTFSLLKEGSEFRYTGPGSVGSLLMEGSVKWGTKVFEREVRDFRVSATSVPSTLSMTMGEEKLSLTQSAPVGSVSFSMALKPLDTRGSGGGSGGGGLAIPNFRVDAAQFVVTGDMSVTITDAPSVVFVGSERNRFVFSNVGGVALGIDFHGFLGGVLNLTDAPRVEIDKLALQSGTGLRARLSLADGAMPEVTVVIPRLPPDLKLVTEPGSLGASILRTEVTPKNGALPEAIVAMGPDEYHGIVIRIFGVPADHRANVWTIGGDSILQLMLDDVLPMGGVNNPTWIDGVSVGKFTDAKHYANLRIGRTKAVRVEADADGGTKYPDNPRFLDVVVQDTSSVYLDIQYGDYGMTVDFGDLKYTTVQTVQLLGKVTVDGATEGLRIAKNGVVGASRATATFIQKGQRYVMDAATVWKD